MAKCGTLACGNVIHKINLVWEREEGREREREREREGERGRERKREREKERKRQSAVHTLRHNTSDTCKKVTDI